MKAEDNGPKIKELHRTDEILCKQTRHRNSVRKRNNKEEEEERRTTIWLGLFFLFLHVQLHGKLHGFFCCFLFFFFPFGANNVKDSKTYDVFQGDDWKIWHNFCLVSFLIHFRLHRTRRIHLARASKNRPRHTEPKMKIIRFFF